MLYIYRPTGNEARICQLAVRLHVIKTSSLKNLTTVEKSYFMTTQIAPVKISQIKLPLKFRKTPLCELSGDSPADCFSFRKGRWVFLADRKVPQLGNEYRFSIEGFFRAPASTVDWLAHLSEKSWFNATEFCDMMERFRRATDSYFCLRA